MPKDLVSGNTILTIPDINETGWADVLNNNTFPAIHKIMYEIEVARGLNDSLNSRLSGFLTNAAFSLYKNNLDTILNKLLAGDDLSLQNHISWSNYRDSIISGGIVYTVQGSNAIISPLNLFINSSVLGIYKIQNSVTLNYLSGTIYSSGDKLYTTTAVAPTLDRVQGLPVGAVPISFFSGTDVLTDLHLYSGATRRQIEFTKTNFTATPGAVIQFSGHFHYDINRYSVTLFDGGQVEHVLTSITKLDQQAVFNDLNVFTIYFNFQSNFGNSSSGLYYSGTSPILNIGPGVLKLKIYG
ncbi:MAG: hypothetical protein QXP66_00845 [Candidatus Aenigmatarchaeota archaeon]